MFNLIFTGFFVLIAVIFILTGMLKGRKYKWQFSVSRIVVVVLSTIAATLISALVSWLLGGLVYGALEGFLQNGNQEIANLINSLPSAADSVRAIIAMLIAPLIFLLFFLVIKAILNIFAGSICKLIIKLHDKIKDKIKSKDATEVSVEILEEVPAQESADASADGLTTVYVEVSKKKKNAEFRSEKKFDGIGAVCGAICGFLIFVAFMAPTVGLFNTIDDTVSVVFASDEESVIPEITGAAADNVGALTVKYLGGDLIYSGLTTYPINGRLASLNREVKFIGSIGNAISDVKDESASDAEAAEAIRKVGERFEDSTMIPMLLSDLLSAASTDWSEGKDFHGISCPSFNKDFDILVQDFVVVMKDSTYETISGDVRTIANTVAVIIENRSAETTSSSGGVLAIFGNEAAVSGVMLELLESERLSPLVESFTNVGISVFTGNLSVPENYDAAYDGFMIDMRAAYEDTMHISNISERMTELSNKIKDNYDKYGIELSSGVSYCIAADMIGELNEPDNSDIEKFFSEGEANADSLYAGEAAIVPLAAAQNGGKALSLTEKIKSRASKEVSKDELSAIVKSELSAASDIAQDMTDEELTELSSEIANAMYKDIAEDSFKYKAAVFNGVEGLKENSVLVTVEDLRVTAGAVTDKEKEAHALAAVFASAIEVVDKVSGSDFEVEEMVVSFGPVLDSFAASEIIGKAHTADLLSAILQSDKVRSSVGFSLVQANNLAGKINNGVENNETYTMMLKSLGDTINIIKLSAESKDTTAAVNELMKDLTPASAEALQMLSTPETVKNYGVSEVSAEPVSNMLSDMFGNMSVAKENGMSEEEYEKESVAVNDMMNIAMASTKSDSKELFGADSATGISATEFVDRSTNSVIVSETFVNTVYEDTEEPKDNPLASGKKPSAEDEDELVSAIDAKWKAQLSTSDDAEANAEYQKVLTSTAAIVNVNLAFNGDTVTAVR